LTVKLHIGLAVTLGLAVLAAIGPAAGAASKAAKPKAIAAKTTAKKASATKPAATKHSASKHTASKTTAAKHVPLPRPRPDGTAKTRTATASLEIPGLIHPSHEDPLPSVSSGLSSAALATVKEAVGLARKGNTSRATEVQHTITDPAARKLVEWVILRSDDNDADFPRYAAFIAANPNWPSIGTLRRRAEAMLWQEHANPTTIRGFFAKGGPATAKGHFALARALIEQGDRAGAQAQLREAWHNENFSPDLETKVLETFPGYITAADHKARMDMRLYAEDATGALRSAARAGGHATAIAKARIAVIRKASNAKALLDALPASEQHHDLGLMFSRIQLLRRADKGAEAGALMLSVPRDPSQAIDTDQWWIERRLVARKLLDLGDFKSAYVVARDAVTPHKENYRIEHEFTAGWIALRFLNDPKAAQVHFMRMAEGVRNPISLARAGYWQGRAAEAMGQIAEARAHYEAAARYPTAYYGQIARARLGHKDMPLRPPPERPDAAQLEVVRAVELLYEVGQNDLAVIAAAGLGDGSRDSVALAAVGKVTARHKDARAMVLLGKLALGRGLPLERYAFPTIGVPDYKAIGPHVDRSLVYAIARQESIFNQKTVSRAKAMGLLQVTPAAGRETAKKFGAKYDGKRLLSDPVYNVQMGAAELGDLMEGYRGSYILTFAGYNAGRGRVREWIQRYGDPRDPQVDPIDWVERIPFSETRNYVQRVMENMQVYRVRFGGGSKLLIEADLRRGASAN
jgi:soluble lytic murein transglycosylase